MKKKNITLILLIILSVVVLVTLLYNTLLFRSNDTRSFIYLIKVLSILSFLSASLLFLQFSKVKLSFFLFLLSIISYILFYIKINVVVKKSFNLMYFISIILLVLLSIKQILYDKPLIIKMEYLMNKKKWYSSYNMSRLSYKEGKLEEAIRYINESANNGAPIEYSSSLLGYYYYIKSDFVKAEKELKNTIDIKIDTHLSAYYLAKIYNEKGQYSKTIELLSAYMEVNNKNNSVIHLLGNTYDKIHKYDKAITAYTKLIELYPMNAFYLYNRGLDYYNMSMEREAINDFLLSIKLDPPDPKSYIMLGIIYNEKNEVLLAKEYFDKGIAIDSSLIEFVPN